jgi:hypothetical protein
MMSPIMPARLAPSCSDTTFFFASDQSIDTTRVGTFEANDVSASLDLPQMTWTYSLLKHAEPIRR